MTAGRRLTDPLLPAAALTLLAVASAALNAAVLCWASIGVLAGFALSGSV